MFNISALYTIQELQNIFKLGKNSTYKLVQLDGFPKIYIGKKILVPEDKLQKWIEENMGSHIEIT